MKKMLKKVISMLIVICLMMGIANIPVYAGANTVSAAKTTDAVLSKTYVTPAQALKKTVKSSAKATAKATAKKVKAIDKTTKKKAAKKVAKKTVSLTAKITKKYTKKGLTVLKKLANKLGLKLKTVYNKFIKMGVTKTQLNKVRPILIKLMNKGEDFVCCSSLAVAKYLGIGKNFAALQNLAADISIDANRFVKAHKNGFTGTYTNAEEKTLKKNGVKQVESINATLKDVMNLKKGQKALVYVDCYDKKGNDTGGHGITIERQKNGKYAVYDILINNGNKIIYNTKEFKKFLQGKSAKGKTEYGKNITKTKYLDSTDGKIRYKFIGGVDKGKIYITIDSSKFIDSTLKKLANKSYSIINKLLNNKNVSSLAKKWLKKAKTLVKKLLNGGKNYYDKQILLDKAASLIQQISKKNTSMISLITSSNSIFSSLQKLFKNNFMYKVYNKYGEGGLNVIIELSKRYNLSQKVVYNQFVNNKVTKTQMEKVSADLVRYTKEGWEVLDSAFGEGYTEVENALVSIKQLLKK
ncbi:hypothetical protein [Candidatus Ruminimicrobium bovinum]|uniref:hypothetical protein n=1 Tax=Candidatus Ruminimicrobium bovinum TaxID=3242779 RepID=UPI0039B86041